MSNATNDKWMLIIMHGDKYWDIQAEYVLPWPEEFPMYKAFRTLYCSDEMMEDSHEELDSPERLLMKRLGTHPPKNIPSKHTIWYALKALLEASRPRRKTKKGTPKLSTRFFTPVMKPSRDKAHSRSYQRSSRNRHNCDTTACIHSYANPVNLSDCLLCCYYQTETGMLTT